MFEGPELYHEFLTYAITLIFPSAIAGMDALSRYDKGEGDTWFFEWSDAATGEGSKDGIVQGCELTSAPYHYVGWAFFKEMNLRVGSNANSNAILNHMLSSTDGSLKNKDLPLAVPTTGYPSDSIRRVREGVERFFITDINNPAGSAKAESTIAVMWDGMCSGKNEHFPHKPGGGNVLFMDGHVEFQHYKGMNDEQFPYGASGFAIHNIEPRAWTSYVVPNMP